MPPGCFYNRLSKCVLLYKYMEIRHKWDRICWIMGIVYAVVVINLAVWASKIWVNINIIYWLGIAVGSVSAVGGIMWQLHSSALLREVWKQERRGIKNYKHYKELVEVDRMWATTLFVMAGLIFTIIAFLHSFLGS